MAPGVRVNFNKHSTSVSLGTRGSRITLNSHGKTTTTLGASGTGVHTIDKGDGPKAQFRARTGTAVPVQLNATQHNAAVRSGVRGAGTTRSTRGSRQHVGLPDTGLSLAQESPQNPPAPRGQKHESKPEGPEGQGGLEIVFYLVMAVVIAHLLARAVMG